MNVYERLFHVTSSCAWNEHAIVATCRDADDALEIQTRMYPSGAAWEVVMETKWSTPKRERLVSA